VTQRRGKVTPLVVHEHHPPVVLARVSGTFFGSAGRMKIMETGEREKRAPGQRGMFLLEKWRFSGEGLFSWNART
jgi:hypothetical protein